MNKTKLTLGLFVVSTGFAYLFITGFQQASSTHMTASELLAYEDLNELAGRRLQLGAQVVEGTIVWDRYHHRPTFTVFEGGAEIAVHYTGSAVVPDTFKDGSPVVLEGYYQTDTGIFTAEVIFAKCPSKYEGQSYEGHAVANQTQ